jgi:PAS domain S-box-containing protein
LWLRRRVKPMLSAKLLDVVKACLERLAETRSLDAVFQTLADRLVGDLGFDCVVILRTEEGAKELRVVAHAPRQSLGETAAEPVSIALEELRSTLPMNQLSSTEAGQVLSGEALEAWLSFLRSSLWRTERQPECHVGWLAPLTSGHQLLGLLFVGDRRRPFTSDEFTLLEQICHCAGNWLMLGQCWGRERSLETLSSIALQLLAVTDWQGAVPAILTDLCGVLRMDFGFVARLAWDERGTLTVHPLCQWSVKEGQFPSAETLRRLLRACLSPAQIAALERGQEVTLIASLSTETLATRLRDFSIPSLLLLPLIVESRLWGVMGFGQIHDERLWSETDTAVLRIAASLLGSAIERQMAMERQLEQERQFRDLFENAVVGIYRSTPEGRFLMANRTLARINGYDSVDELMALNIPEQFYANPQDRERFKRLMEEQGFVADFRYPIKRKDGSIGWIAEWARAVRDEVGRVRYYEGFVLDITEQVALSQRLQGLQEIAHALVARLDLESVLHVAVQELSRLYPDGAVIILRHLPEQRSYLIAVANEAGRQWLRVVGQEVGSLLPERPFHPLEQRLRRGETIVVDASVNPLSFGQVSERRFCSAFLKGLGTLNEFWGMLAVLRNDAEFRPHDLTFLNSFCDYLSIAIRNATLLQQLQQAYEELRATQERAIEQERLRALGQMASGIAHDINNALVPIQGFAELLSEHDDPTVRNAAQVIFKAARDITTVVQRMREFYRPRTKEEPLEPLDLNALCQDALAMTRPRWHNIPQERGIVIEPRLALGDDLPPVVGISNEVRQAIVNLILNAADAMPEGGILTLRTYRAERDGQVWAVVEVSDTGIGMDEETKRRAVEPFFTTKGERGSGLGLSAVYGTMQRHDGLLEMESELGKGTTVRLWFPSRQVTTEAMAVGEVPPMRLLVIDDEPFVREMIANLLRWDGHWVVTAPDGEQGIATFEAARQSSEPFDAVITDLGMPKVDGFSVARAIKALSPSTPVLLLSGWGFRLEGEEMHALIDGVLAKPATHQQLRRALFILRQRRENPSQKLGDD